MISTRLSVQTRSVLFFFRDIIHYLCMVSEHRRIFFLWRPFLKDPKDDMVLELAVEADGILNFLGFFNAISCEKLERYHEHD